MHRLLLLLLLLLCLWTPTRAANTHGTPDPVRELQASLGDALGPYVVSGCLPTVPSSSLVLGTFACTAYVRGSAQELVYVSQAAATVTLTNVTGAWWLAVHRDVSTAVSTWTRRAGTHYLVKQANALPADPSGGLVVAELTVSGGVIAAVKDRRLPASYARTRLYDVTDPLYGAVGDGTTDDTTAITTALAAAGYRAGSIGGSDALTTTPLTGGAIVYVPPGTYKMTAQTNIPLRITLKGAGYASVLKKVMNGYLLSMSSWSRLEDLAIDGQGATSVGGGVVINEGTNVEIRGRQMIRRVAIYDTENYNIEYAGAGVGYGSSIMDCDFRVHAGAQPAIKMPNDGVNPGNRHVINNRSMYSDLAEFDGCQNCTFIGNMSGNGDGSHGGIVFSGGADGKKGIFVGNRFATAAPTLIEGVDHVFAANVFGAGVTLGSTTNNVRFDYSNVVVPAGATSVIDTDPFQANLSYSEVLDWTPIWNATGSQPAIGNGVLRGRYHRNGKRTYVEIYLSAGTTTTFGTGTWVFGLPGTASNAANGVVYVGTAWMRDGSAPADYVGGVWVTANGTAIHIVGYNTATEVGATVPFTWAQGDQIFISMSFDR